MCIKKVKAHINNCEKNLHIMRRDYKNKYNHLNGNIQVNKRNWFKKK
jgi:hypothetical protein